MKWSEPFIVRWPTLRPVLKPKIHSFLYINQFPNSCNTCGKFSADLCNIFSSSCNFLNIRYQIAYLLTNRFKIQNSAALFSDQKPFKLFKDRPINPTNKATKFFAFIAFCLDNRWQSTDLLLEIESENVNWWS